jgi:2,4-dienoyl-CoA reductase-like NADH-dependent reductase (Old Yellow Enzyme family)
MQTLLILNQPWRNMQMSPEVALLDELWDIVKIHVPKKDRIEFAETILRTFEEHLSLDDIEEHIQSFDSAMKAAIKSHFDYLLDKDDDDNDWDD